jgi:hypothetical protein
MPTFREQRQTHTDLFNGPKLVRTVGLTSPLLQEDPRALTLISTVGLAQDVVDAVILLDVDSLSLQQKGLGFVGGLRHIVCCIVQSILRGAGELDREDVATAISGPDSASRDFAVG